MIQPITPPLDIASHPVEFFTNVIPLLGCQVCGKCQNSIIESDRHGFHDPGKCVPNLGTLCRFKSFQSLSMDVGRLLSAPTVIGMALATGALATNSGERRVAHILITNLNCCVISQQSHGLSVRLTL
jgi:hypothetical protein